MTRVIDVLMKFAKACTTQDGVPDHVVEAANRAIRNAVKLRGESAVLHIVEDEDGATRYIGSQEALNAWVRSNPGKAFRTEDLIL